MKKLILFCFLFFNIAGLKSQDCCQLYPKIKSDSVMPILAWHGVLPEFTSVDRFKEVKECGINMHFTETYPNADELQKALDAAQQAGIKLIISCPELEKDPEATVRRFMNHPALAGYFLRDEPSTASYPELAEWAKRIRSVDNEHFCYLNLNPTYAPLEALQAKSYRDYVRRFDEEVGLQLLSFDHYPVVNQELRGDWYENLEIFSEEARRAGKPFWAFALTTAHTPYPIPTLAEIRLQMYSNLAYGAQGLQYFTYWNPRDNPHWNFHHAPLTLEGKRTDVYDKVKEMNKEITALTGVFLGSEVLWVRHTGDQIPNGTKKLTTLPSKVKKLETGATGAVVSELRKGNDKFLVIVNRDFKNRLELNITLDGSVKRILKDGSIVPASLYSDTMMIDPGDVMIYMYQ